MNGLRGVLLPAAAAVLLGSGAAQAETRICRVADPSGTPLNIRVEPDGKIVASARNRSPILVFTGEGKRDAKGRLWHLVALMDSAAPDGYAVAALISCR